MRITPLVRASLLWLAPVALLSLGCSEGSAPAKSSTQSSPAPLRTAPAGELPRPSADPALKQKIIAAMSGYEHIVTKTELDGLGDPAALTAALLAVYDDPAVHLAVRTNALASLRHYPSPTARVAYESALLATDTPDVIRRSAIKAYAVGFGQEAVPVLARVLDHPELHTRNIAAKTLLQLGGGRATQALRHRLPNERETLVKSTIEAGLRAP